MFGCCYASVAVRTEDQAEMLEAVKLVIWLIFLVEMFLGVTKSKVFWRWHRDTACLIKPMYSREVTIVLYHSNSPIKS